MNSGTLIVVVFSVGCTIAIIASLAHFVYHHNKDDWMVDQADPRESTRRLQRLLNDEAEQVAERARKDADVKMKQEEDRKNSRGAWEEARTNYIYAHDPARISVLTNIDDEILAAEVAPVKAACLYVSYTSDGVVREHSLHMCESVKKAGYDVVFVSNQPELQITDRMRECCKYIVTRENTGYDFGAWHDMLFRKRDLWNMYEYTHVLLTNDTVAGPLHGSEQLKKITQSMRSTGCDYWGMCENDHDGIWHLQSFWIELGPAILRDPVTLSQCFLPAENIVSKSQVITACEVPMSRRLAHAGYRPGVAFPSLQAYDKPNAAVWHWNDMVRRGFPLIKQTVEVLDAKRVPYHWKRVLEQYCPKYEIARVMSMFDDSTRMKYLHADQGQA